MDMVSFCLNCLVRLQVFTFVGAKFVFTLQVFSVNISFALGLVLRLLSGVFCCCCCCFFFLAVRKTCALILHFMSCLVFLTDFFTKSRSENHFEFLCTTENRHNLFAEMARTYFRSLLNISKTFLCFRLSKW